MSYVQLRATPRYFACQKCGVLVVNTQLHDEFHRNQHIGPHQHLAAHRAMDELTQRVDEQGMSYVQLRATPRYSACQKCGVLVVNTQLHDEFHRNQHIGPPRHCARCLVREEVAPPHCVSTYAFGERILDPPHVWVET